MPQKHLRFALFGNAFQARKSVAIQHITDILKAHGAEVLIDRPYYEFLVRDQHLDIWHTDVFDGEDFTADFAVSLGGDGTFRGAHDLSRFGVSVVGVPGTIDNDIVCTDYTIGFDTAANTAVECIDRLRDTMQSHERCSVVEVMGRHAGYLALYVGVAVGATAVLVPEHQYDFEKHVAEKIRAARLGGKTNFMIVVAEGAASAMDVGKEIKEHLGLDPRVTILGHIQRGGSPTAKDRVLATRMGYEAVRVLAEGMTNRVICVRDDQIVNVDIDEGLAMKKTLNAEEFEVMTVMTGV